MKSSLKKLRGFTLQKSPKANMNESVAQVDDMAQASKDMQEMSKCYDGLLSAAAAVANSAYEFSESLQEMGACLLQQTTLNIDAEGGKVLLMLGKVQYELRRLVDNYRSHIFQTITTPSESLLNELRNVEEMKSQCDEKRNVYLYIKTQKEKGKKGVRGESFSSQDLQTAKEEYEEEATLFGFRLKSLKQGQSRSLLTQAARHYTAQLSFFKKGLSSLEDVEPHVRQACEHHHIDCQLSEPNDDHDPDNGELSFEPTQDDAVPEVSSSSRNSMELDQQEVSASFVNPEAVQETMEKPQFRSDLLRPTRETMSTSHSAPILQSADKRSDHTDKVKNFNTYVLPMPTQVMKAQQSSIRQTSPPIPPSSATIPMPPSNIGLTKTPPILGERTNRATPTPLPPIQLEPTSTSDPKRIKRQAFSGPLSSKFPGSKPLNPIFSLDQDPLPKSGNNSRYSVSSSSPPIISELHELPRPPGDSSKLSKPLSLVPYSAPLFPKRTQQEGSGTVKPGSLRGGGTAAPLPKPPPGLLPRSFSIPSSGQKAQVSLPPAKCDEISEGLASPPLRPIMFPSGKNPK
ncbi:hypothetical protein AMTRI_Chr02g222000 [Amborella trichopoda]|uniref:BAR domain-containing protein n=1 Tax=Amborella trichopoda TaxID=13333 RepID=U5D3T7_AMBTC|nr:uncharacterized protein At2g33490 [Amborella trichopoda]ERN16910.1 hypothetical protein AMTR_s00057p00168150 [Amborella trichopoda]|eukprot:XP_020529766.1 uncharacterized protein At2g33490 [Amborella trichopoda]